VLAVEMRSPPAVGGHGPPGRSNEVGGGGGVGACDDSGAGFRVGAELFERD
jgi:hypothetical protein